jgi:hypothetical protein
MGIGKSGVGLVLGIAIGVSGLPVQARSEPVDAPRASQPDETLEQARSAFREGVAKVKEAHWGEALAAFERSQALKQHAITTFNIGACERALGRYTRARSAFQRALREEQATPGQLAVSLREDAQGFLAQIEQLLVLVEVEVTPGGSSLTVDGRPLVIEQLAGGAAQYVTGLLAPGPGMATPEGKFRLLLDPGAHVLTLQRKGFTDVVVRRSFAPGEQTRLVLQMEQMPASLRIAANVPSALVRVNGEDVGPVPVALLRPAGIQEVVVRKPGYVPYSAKVTAAPGEELNLNARLVVESQAITSKWWFWVASAAILAGGAFATYALTRPADPAPPYAGGNTDWVAFPGRAEF